MQCVAAHDQCHTQLNKGVHGPLQITMKNSITTAVAELICSREIFHDRGSEWDSKAISATLEKQGGSNKVCWNALLGKKYVSAYLIRTKNR